MQFINKFKYKRKGHRIIKAFIKDKWNNDIQRYVNLNYNELKRIKAFKYLLLKEQQGFCCYCMRKIPFIGDFRTCNATSFRGQKA